MFIHPTDSALEKKTFKLMFPLTTINSDEFKDLYTASPHTKNVWFSDTSMSDNTEDITFPCLNNRECFFQKPMNCKVLNQGLSSVYNCGQFVS